MIEIFTQGRDIHSEMASLIFKKSLSEITKKSVERYAAKRIVHASDYDMHANTFAKRYNKDAADAGYPLISVAQAQAFLNAFHEAVPELRSGYHAHIQELVSKTKILTNPFGRRMIFHDRIGQDLFRQAYAWYAQSTVADITNTILEAIWKSLDVLLQVHDSILIQCKPDEINDIVKFMKSANPTVEVGGTPLRIPMEFKTSEVSWFDLKELEAVAA